MYIFKKRLAITHDETVLKFELQITCATLDFVMWIATTKEIRELAIQLLYIFAENDRELW